MFIIIDLLDPDKAQACERVYGYVRALLGWTVLQCEIECCTGDKCNTGTFPTVPTSGSGTKKKYSGILQILELLFNIRDLQQKRYYLEAT